MKRVYSWAGIVMVVAALCSTAIFTTVHAENPPLKLGKPAPYISPFQFEQYFIDAAEKVRPTVVSIYSTKTISATLLAPFRLSPFEDFFGRDPFDLFPQRPGETRRFEQRGMGSGVIVDEQGYILTNNHVVAGADSLQVRLEDGREFPATIVGTDAKTDIAVIRIEASDLTAAELGDSSHVKVGQWVMAVGSPMGLQQTVTSGIISATGRDGIGITQYEDFIQTDAAINHGNSGGPLIDLHGRVIGINTAIMSENGGSVGIGMAIPIDMARSIMQQLVDTGTVSRGYLGVYIQNLTRDLARSFGYKDQGGALIGDVIADSPAATAGLQAGDIVLKFNDETVKDSSMLRHRIAQAGPGSKVKFHVFRNGKTLDITVKLGELTENVVKRSSSRSVDIESPDVGLGIRLSDPNPQMLRQLQLPADTSGAVVTRVEPQSLAAKAGLKVGDVITEVNGVAVGSAAEAARSLQKQDLTEGVRLRVRSGEGQMYVFIKK